MKTTFLLLSALLLVTPLFSAPPQVTVKAKTVEEIYFIVNDEIITRLDYLEQEATVKRQAEKAKTQIANMRQQGFDPKAIEQAERNIPSVKNTDIISNMILASLLRQEAVRQGIITTPLDVSNRMRSIAQNNGLQGLEQLEVALANEGVTLKSFYEMQRNMMINESLMGRNMTLTEPSLEEVQTYYEKYKEKEFSTATLGKMYHVAHILFEASENMTFTDKLNLKQKADNALLEIKIGLAFDKAAQRYSDEVSTRSTGGDMGWVFERDFAEEPAVREGLKNLKTGELSPVISGIRGFYLLKLIELKEKGILPLEKASFMIKNLLVAKKRQEAIEKQIEQIKLKSLIEVKTDFFGKYLFK